MTSLLIRAARFCGYFNHLRQLHKCCALPLIYALLLMAAVGAGASDAPRAQREAAVIEARNGGTQAGLTALEALLEQYPDDRRLLADTTIVANWAGNDQLALDLYSRQQTPKDDAGVVEAAARSARNLHRYDESIELFRHAQTLEPERWQSHLGEAMALTDRGDYAAAASLMQPLLRLHKDEKDVVLGEGYLCSRQADFACTIAMYEDYLAKTPNDMQVRTDLAVTLSRLGSRSYASALYAEDVVPAEPATERSLSAAAAAAEVNWGEVYAPTRTLQRADSERALAGLDAVIAASNPKEAIWRSAQFDRILALCDLRRPRDAVQSYETLKKQGLDVPAYALEDVAGAYLSLHQPERAEFLYRKLLDGSPADGSLWSSLAYAQMDGGHAYQALATIDHAYKASAPWFRLKGMSSPRVNQMRLNLESQAALMRRDVDLLAEAQRRLERLADAAPGNENVRWQLAGLYLARGWTLRAKEESRIADSYATSDELPSQTSVEIDAAAGLRDNVDAMLPALRSRESDSPALTRFLSEERMERGWQLDAETVFGWGSGVQVGSDDQHSETHLYAPLLDNRWRFYGHELSDSGDFGTGSAERTRGSAGVRYDYARQQAWAEFGYDAGANRNAGNIGTRLSLNDFLTLRVEGDSDSFDVPVRAITGNVHGRSLDTDLEWHGNELSTAHLDLQRLLFSDGNQRTAISSAWNQRVWTNPRWKASINTQEWESANSLDENRPYSNPKHDFSLGPDASVDWLTWQRYDRSFRQTMGIYVGPYWQANYGTEGAVSVHYAQSWKMSSRVDWHCGVTWSSQPYDGSKETRTALSAGFSWGGL